MGDSRSHWRFYFSVWVWCVDLSLSWAEALVRRRFGALVCDGSLPDFPDAGGAPACLCWDRPRGQDGSPWPGCWLCLGLFSTLGHKGQSTYCPLYHFVRSFDAVLADFAETPWMFSCLSLLALGSFHSPHFLFLPFKCQCPQIFLLFYPLLTLVLSFH